jgi:hypothetical protein
VCHRDPESFGYCGCRADARNQFEWYPCVFERAGLFTAAPEDETVSALEPDHSLALARFFDKQCGDLGLRHAVRAVSFSDRYKLAVRRRIIEKLFVQQFVIADDLS